MKNKTQVAIFAGGCFWCMIPPFQKIPGVLQVIAGYTGGKTKNPTYQEVSKGNTGHYEAVQITYDPLKVKYEKLLEVFWQQINPEDAEGQFADKGSQYKTAIFYHDKDQKIKSEQSKRNLEKMNKFKKIATEIKKATVFYPAEEYHQDYHKKNPIQYTIYKKMSGREGFLNKIWKNK